MVKRVTIDVTDYTKQVYLNSTTGELVQATDPTNDLSRNLGLHRYDFKTNGEDPGKGKGAAVRITKQKVLAADIPTPEDSERALDREGLLLTQPEDGRSSSHRTKCEMREADFLLSSECGGYGGYTSEGVIWQEGMPPQVYWDDGIYLIRSAPGEITRLHVLDYQDGKKHCGYITIEYAIQVDRE